ncbi:LysR family transcriptional regulator [Pseudomonas chlororaphis]|uniref:LysR family transcriptional regulator n=1 Tax=Pseudomonas chlororaphis TaxID=587753 RepID=UPI0007B3C7E5|nr:LysR family transcriptional regulator [Pseudomonas chlororaphis]AZC50046.1 Transcriptional regulator, LysR family [Pseudomonas chlororaphis subsp. piscium]AZC56625.1 Transcriptional regulator, LysR family [Pseudomonas chlororaphis subsp. piscium]AZC62842.1 Transcriptional regulator, LysR family [Pseudomonas chlororaphis subsp. piscium]AZC69078.1 Transcriptional regulator, LysR family [Pseudomonas chlororaphis subsp. piscium]AZC75261.1 Transcriptional regulator, LysR family [Pseudomonas chlo
MDRIECMRAFVVTVDANGFAAAARAMDVPRSKVSKQIQALEEAIGVQLLHRTTRSLHLTEAGAEYYESAREVLAAVDEAEQRARDGIGELRGVLRVNAPMSFGLRRLGPLVPLFHEQHPNIELQLVLSDQQVDPVRGGFDVTIRIASLADSSMVAKLLAPAPRIMVASPDYLKRAGTPQTPRDLTAHQCLNYGYLQSGVSLQLSNGKDTQRVHVTGPLHANNGDLLAQAAEAGMGIALLPDFIVADALAAGRLVPVLCEWQAPPISIHAVYPSARRVPQKTRAFIEFLVAQLADKPPVLP